MPIYLTLATSSWDCALKWAVPTTYTLPPSGASSTVKAFDKPSSKGKSGTP